MTSIFDKPIDETSEAYLLDASTEACAQHGISPDGGDGSDLATTLRHMFQRGIVRKDRFIALFLTWRKIKTGPTSVGLT